MLPQGELGCSPILAKCGIAPYTCVFKDTKHFNTVFRSRIYAANNSLSVKCKGEDRVNASFCVRIEAHIVDDIIDVASHEVSIGV